MSANKNLIKTSLNLPKEIYKRIEAFADDVCINRNAAMIYLLSRGLNYEYDFENYMKRKVKKKIDSQPAISYSIKKRMNDKAKQRLERDENRAIYSAIRYDENLRKMILDYARGLSGTDVNNLFADAGWIGYKRIEENKEDD